MTQNVDGLHELALEEVAARDGPRALSRGALPLKLHGSLFRIRCVACRFQVEHRDPVDTTSEDSLPRCPQCDSLLRPAVVWFGESLEAMTLDAAISATETAEVCLVVGTSAVVHPAASLLPLTHRAGGVIVEVNLEPTPPSGMARMSFRAPAAEIVPRLLAS